MKKLFKEGDIVIYREKTYLFDRYYPDGKYAAIFLLEDDSVNLFETGSGDLIGYEVKVSELEKYNG